MSDATRRPDPDKLLEKINRQPRGKLKIFFGACAGVGKTYAMLQEALRLQSQGVDVLVGVVETHGRQETAGLLNSLNIQPARHIHHRGQALQEFDLDAALARKPHLILMDELAHSNMPGSRHPKRWQDVEELLEAGIDVFTSLNVQHLESLNDIVSKITGIQVRETIPDPIFDAADNIVLVDLPPEDLHQRLYEGKVYRPGQARPAIEDFFHTGNLIALRKLALHRTAERVDKQMRDWRDRQNKATFRDTQDAVLLCLSHRPGNEKLVRNAARFAAKSGCLWHAIYVETPGLHRLPESQRRQVLSALHLAQELGAETTILTEPNEKKAVLRYAREHYLDKIVIGRHTTASWWQRISFADWLAKLAPDLDLLIISLDETPHTTTAKRPDTPGISEKLRVQLRGCAVAVLLCTLISLIANQWLIAFDAANLVMIYLAGVVVVALFYGRWPSVLATIINVISFDLFFIAPRGSLAVSDTQYLLTFGVMLTVGLVIGNLTAGIRYQARIARYREQRTRQLYEVSKALAGVRTPQEMAANSVEFITNTFQASCQVLLPDNDGTLNPVSSQGHPAEWDRAIARWSFDKGQPAGAGTNTLPGLPYQILPLHTPEKTLGLLLVTPKNRRQLMLPEQQRLLETVTLLIANTLDRLLLAASEEQARFSSEREQLRNSLLASLSHDLRTPLTVLFGQAEILTLHLTSEGSKHAPLANEIRQYVLNTTRLVNNLLDMARIQSVGFSLHKEWLTLEEVVGSALKMLEPGLGGRHINLTMPDPLILIEVDGPLFERVLINLLENAVKYAGSQSVIGLRATLVADILKLEIWDNGPGIPQGKEQLIFDKFARGNKESAIPGVGLGLTICQAIIELHGGRIYAVNRPEGGASFYIILPLTPSPDLPEMSEII